MALPPERKLYGLIISRLEGKDVGDASYRRRLLGLSKKGIGGFIIFGGMKDEVKGFVRELQAASAEGLLIASDIERGVGQQIGGYTPMPCQMAQAAAIGKGQRKDVRLPAGLFAGLFDGAINAVAAEATDAGINMPLVPVLDVNSNPDNPIISTRAFSDDPEVVSWFGSRYIRLLEKSGLITCPKHFPGHGDTEADSHISLPVINKTIKELMATEIAPFKAAVRAGASSIMAGHLLVPCLDDFPATLSKKIISGLLRRDLGFRGLVVTDALNMDALSEFGTPATLALKAGADILLHPKDPDYTVKELLSSIKSGELKEARVNSALGRIASAKRKTNRLRHGPVKTKIDFEAHSRISKEITERSITLVKGKAGLLPIKKLKVITAGDEGLFERQVFEHIHDPRSKTSLIAVFTSVAAWKGTSGISPEEIRRVKGLIKKSAASMVVSFGSPYVLRHFMEADCLIAAYEATGQAQRAALDCLRGAMPFIEAGGTAPFRGRLPVKISP